jgi:hypothetical protein
MTGNKPFCRRCMFDEMMENYDGTLEKYISSIDGNIKTEKEEYESRIEMCGNCNQLVNGLWRKFCECGQMGSHF